MRSRARSLIPKRSPKNLSGCANSFDILCVPRGFRVSDPRQRQKLNDDVTFVADQIEGFLRKEPAGLLAALEPDIATLAHGSQSVVLTVCRPTPGGLVWKKRRAAAAHVNPSARRGASRAACRASRLTSPDNPPGLFR